MNSREIHNDWITKLKSGDPEVFEHIRTSFHAELHAFARKLVHDPDDAKDMVSEALIALWKLRNGFDSMVNIRAFLYTAVRNSSFNFLKRHKRRLVMEKQFNYLFGQQEETKDIELSVLIPEIHDLISKLPNRCRLIFTLTVLQGHHTDEVARKLNIRQQTVLNQKARAIRLLRKSLLKYPPSR